MRRLALVLLVAAGCSRHGDDATCGAVATHVFAMSRAALASATVAPATQRAIADQLPAIRDSLTQSCRDGKWSTQVRNCMVTAGNPNALQACQAQLTDEQRRGLEGTALGETAAH